MGGHTDVDGLDTWIDVRGSGERTVVLLHGGMGNSDDLLDSIGPRLEDRFRLVAFDRRGHGRTRDTDEPFHYDDMATHTIAVLERPEIAAAATGVDLVGWSDGAIVAMLVAIRRPDLVDRLVLIGGNFHYDGVHELDSSGEPEQSPLYEGYAARSPDGPDHYRAVAEKWMTLITTEPTLTTADLARIDHPALVLAGDDDLVKLAHTVELFEALPAGRLCILPGTSHLVPFERAELVASVIADFLEGPAEPATMLPVRRRPA
ncbi:alpha/beta hydrolase [Agromyces sp. G08B096]|uniref:Alpha/beta hydrolase n=1 Tax=Agromyces sp. G08B096 TaxID=3156399 RepID=A0AAU7WAH0_9MICO